MKKSINFKVRGMQRDLSESSFNPEYAYEIKNMRLMPTTDNTMLSLVNEKGNKLTTINGVGDSIEGVPIGQAVLNDNLIIFTAGNKNLIEADITATEGIISDIDSIEGVNIPNIKTNFNDIIYKLWFNNGILQGKELFNGELNFSYNYPIETIEYYENENIQKIYWTDGLNQPRMINIAAAEETIEKWSKYSFDFTVRLSLQESVTISKITNGNGSFSAGVIQYVFTYYNKYGQESNIFYTSPLYYTSYGDRGLSSEQLSSNAFQLSLMNLDNKFNFVRIYSIFRTSIDATPTIKIVTDIPVQKSYYETNMYNAKVAEPISIIGHDNLKESFESDFMVGMTITYMDNTTKVLTIADFTDPDTTDNAERLYLLTSGNISGSLVKSVSIPSQSITIVLDGKFSHLYMELDYTDGYFYVDMNDLISDKYKVENNILGFTYIDNGSTGSIIDSTALLYVGGEEVVFGTMTQKDNTLFFGDISINRKSLDNTVKQYFKTDFSIIVVDKNIELPVVAGTYTYSSQLDKSSNDITHYKNNETYRLGIQLQHYSGRLSEPLFISDETLNYNPKANTILTTTFGKFVGKITNSTFIKYMISLGYIRIRPVVVFPSLHDREVICQGVLCPTVFNVTDRSTNAPFVQSSWFTRPSAAFDVGTTNTTNLDSTTINEYTNSRVGHVLKGPGTLTLNKGSWAEFRHFYPLPSSINRNAEIQLNYLDSDRTYDLSSDRDDNYIQGISDKFYIDQSIVTLHSPEIEFNDSIQNMDLSSTKLRIIGAVPITAYDSSIDLTTSTSALQYKNTKGVSAFGFYNEKLSTDNNSTLGWKGLISAPMWIDEVAGRKTDNPNNVPTGFVVYPWHRSGSLNNTSIAVDGYKSATLSHKTLANLRFSYNNVFITEYWKNLTGLSDVQVFNANELSLLKLKAPLNSPYKFKNITYYGNVDKVIVPHTKYVSSSIDYSDGYPIVFTTTTSTDTSQYHNLFSGTYSSWNVIGAAPDKTLTDQIGATDPVSMKYKSTPHAVIVLNYSKIDNDYYQNILPTTYDNSSIVNPISDINKNYFWENVTSSGVTNIHQDAIKISIDEYKSISNINGNKFGFLWLAELYRDNIQNKFGGNNEEAFENNSWQSAGGFVSLLDGEIPKTEVNISWDYGDTYYQRYDHLKTYPYTSSDTNSIVDIISFMCETRVNIDGRYDRNRGQSDNTNMTPTNFNLLNPVYSQSDNYFIYRKLDDDILDLDIYRNSISFTETKVAGDKIDLWTKITLASTLDLDGDKGRVRALRRYNNELFAFQDKGISNILFNSRTQINTSDNIPIEIANSGKVDGKRYLSDKVGCINKWSISESPNGLYFVDDITKNIYLFNGNLLSLSDKLGFHSWINSNSTTLDTWTPKDSKAFRTLYDKIKGETYFITDTTCLVYSENLGQFISFFSYEGIPFMVNLENKVLQINTMDNSNIYRIWTLNEGDYNYYFGSYKPFYVTYIANPEPTLDKMFTNINYRSDTWSNNTYLESDTFDTLKVWNEYQTSTKTLTFTKGSVSNLKKKFRSWYIDIPRDSRNHRDRIRNPWIYLTLTKNNSNINKTVLHDVEVTYYDL